MQDSEYTLTHQNAVEVTVIDPVSHSGKLHVPIDRTFDTKGRQEWLRAGGNLRKDLSICCLYQQGRCHAGQRCHQVHVDREYVSRVRAEHADDVTCCLACGDASSREGWYVSAVRGRVATVVGASESIDIALDRLARTQGLETLLSNATGVSPLSIPSARVCRLHLRDNCKYGKDCKNVHVCSKLSKSLPEAQQNVAQTSKQRVSRNSVGETSSRSPRPTSSQQFDATTTPPRSAAGTPNASVSLSPARKTPEVGILNRNVAVVESEEDAQQKLKKEKEVLAQQRTKRAPQPLSAAAAVPPRPANSVVVAVPSPIGSCRRSAAIGLPATPTTMLSSFCDMWRAPQGPESPCTLSASLTDGLRQLGVA